MKAILNRLFVIAVIILTLLSCKKEPTPIPPDTTTVPTVRTLDATNVGVTGARFNGDILDDGELSISDKGFYYSLHTSPTTSDTKISKGAGNSSFFHDFTGDPNTTYYYITYARNSKGTDIGTVTSFTTDEDGIAITTQEVSDITLTSAICGGTITEGVTIAERGLVRATDHDPTVDDVKYIDSSGSNSFQCAMDDLTPDTENRVRSYSINGQGVVYYGEVKTFSTLKEADLAITGSSDLTMTSVNVTLDITANGSTISEAGLCWVNSGVPTVDDNKIIGSNTGGIISMTGLANNTKHQIRGYIITDTGTFYTGIIEAWTYAFFDYDGNGYHTVEINGETWTVENWKCTHYADGTPIPNVTDRITWANLTTGAMCWYDNDKDQYHNTYGALYNWYSIQGLAPDGWHVATDPEWVSLNSFLGDNAGGKIKETGFAHWRSPNSGATNESGFTALPGGGRANVLAGNGTFVSMAEDAVFWTSTERTINDAWSSYASYNKTNIQNNYAFFKTNGHSIRLVKDSVTPEASTKSTTGEKVGEFMPYLDGIR